MNVPTSVPPIARLLNFALIAVIIFLIAALVIMLIGGVSLLLGLAPESETYAIERLSESGSAIVNRSGLIYGALGGAVMAGAYLYVALVVKAIVNTTLVGNPFVEENISRLRKTWVVIALVEIFRMVITGIMPHAAGDSVGGFEIETRLSAWFLVFVIATMAEVFRIGLELRRDQELTV